MKSIEAIVERAIILVCVSDRCALEKNIINGRTYSLSERETQRNAVYQWLKSKGYTRSLTENEKALFELEVGKGEKNHILAQQVQYEAIEPCLWIVGLTETLSSYDNFVLDDFHPLLEFRPNHSLDMLVSKCKLRDLESIQKQKEISMLWHWRTREADRPIFKEKDARKIIVSVFGSEFEKVADGITYAKGDPKDFSVGSKPFYRISNNELKKISAISLWRHHAFEWIISNDKWDEVDTST